MSTFAPVLRRWSGRIVILVALGVLVLALTATLASSGEVTTTIRSKSLPLPMGSSVQVHAKCALGEVVTGGGYQVASINPDIVIHQSVPFAPTPGVTQVWRWTVTAVNDTGADVDFIQAYAVCQKEV